MIYINDDIPSSYKYLVEASDNYICLTNDRYVQGDYMTSDTIDVYYCYFSPSFQYFHTTRSFNYSTTFTDVSSSFTDDFYYALDFPYIISVSLLVTLCLCLIFNGFTRIISRGGILFNK